MRPDKKFHVDLTLPPGTLCLRTNALYRAKSITPIDERLRTKKSVSV
jgi:hypothetical protein